MTMDAEIDRFKKQNGNVSYSTKELIQGLHVKFDDFVKDNHKSHDQMRERFAKGEGKFGEIEGTLKARALFMKIFPPAIISMMGGLLLLMLHLHGIL
jgi:hypothetical protein